MVGNMAKRNIASFRLENMTDFSIIGKRIALVDAAGKTTGQGKYTDDLSVPEC